MDVKVYWSQEGDAWVGTFEEHHRPSRPARVMGQNDFEVEVLLRAEDWHVEVSHYASGQFQREHIQAADAEEAKDDEDLMGVEIEITPAGKSMKRLSLLSGGEKSMTAIAFLFSVFLARPCPFYILDEVEAALDDANISRFLSLLEAYADRAQFIVVTHQKRTMEAADTLYGVSMGDDGVSKVVSRRLPRERAAEAA